MVVIPKYQSPLWCLQFVFIILLLSSTCLFGFVFGQPTSSTTSVTDAASNTDANLFQNLYNSIEQVVIPPYDTTFGTPTEVILFEMPGLVVNRDEYDQTTWAANSYQRRQPDAVLAQFVDRLPYYTGPIFVDSGSRISTIWGTLMYQYIIPIVDDPVQEAKVDAARAGLANGTLITAYDDASTAYEQSFNQLVQFRSDCLAKSGGGVCSAQAVIYRERLKRKWFSLEVARRDIAAAEAKIIALQVQDMQNFFAEQLYNYASNERVDMGADGFGQSFYQTFLTPSNFYKWWPSTGITQYSAVSDGTSVVVAIPPTATIVQGPTHGHLTPNPSGNYSYTANIGITTIDSVTYTSPNANDATITDTFTVNIAVVGSDVLAADSAFVKVAASSVSSSSEEKSFSSTLKTKFDASGEYGLFKASGGADTTNTNTRSSLTSSGSSFKMSLEIARVAITRPWLDTSILAYYPVAIRATTVNGWSDGTITPADNAASFRFKVLPVAFIVGRNIDIEMQFTQYQNDLQTKAQTYNANIQVSYGPVFSGSASASYDSNSRDYKESSHNTTNGISIRGPQIIGWICTAIPPFPTADQATVRAWEADQVARLQLQNPTTTATTA